MLIGDAGEGDGEDDVKMRNSRYMKASIEGKSSTKSANMLLVRVFEVGVK